MNDFIKSILKSNFRYDDDGFFGDDHYSMHEGARYLKKIMDDDDVISELVIYGANNGFSSSINPKINEWIELRKSLRGNSKLNSTTSLGTVSTKKRYEKLSSEIKKLKKKYKIESNTDIGVRPCLMARMEYAEKQLERILDSGLRTYGCESLRDNFAAAKNTLSEIKSTLKEILDVSSKNALEQAEKISDILDNWLNYRLSSILEDGELKSKSKLTDPLKEIGNILNSWGNTSDKHILHKHILERDISVYLEKMLLHSDDRDITENRDTLKAIKKKNSDILSDINNELSKFPKVLQNEASYTRVKEIFEREDALPYLIRKIPGGAGIKYFEGRIQEEEKFYELAKKILIPLKDQKTVKTLETIYKRTNTEVEQMSKLKKYLNDELIKTIRDFKNLDRYAGQLSDNGTQESIAPIIKSLEAYLEGIQPLVIADNKETQKCVDKISKYIAELRTLSLSTSKRENILFDLNSEFDNLSKINNSKDKGIIIVPFLTYDEGSKYENIRNEKADTLTCAAFVMKAKSENDSFFKSFRKELEEDRLLHVGEYEKEIAEVNNDIEKRNRQFDETRALFDAACDSDDEYNINRYGAEMDRITEEIDSLCKERDELQEKINSYIPPKGYKLMVELLKKVNQLFARNITAPYTARATAMVQNDLYDLEKIFEKFKELAFSKEKDFEFELRALTKKIELVIARFNTSDINVTTSKDKRADRNRKTEEEKAADIAKAKAATTEKANSYRDKYGKKKPEGTSSGTKNKDPVKEDKDLKSGKTTTVNTEPTNIDLIDTLDNLLN